MPAPDLLSLDLLLRDTGLSLGQLLLDLQGRRAETAVACAEQPSVEAAIMFDGTNAVRGQTQGNRLAENFGRERADLQIRLPAATRLVVRVADIIAKMRLLAADGAYSCHNSLAGVARPLLVSLMRMIALSAGL